jgi:serine/threonine protein kinase/serine phosphatase RsbU (regulator of sigma subunit)
MTEDIGFSYRSLNKPIVFAFYSTRWTSTVLGFRLQAPRVANLLIDSPVDTMELMVKNFLDYKTIRELGRGAKGIVYLVEKDGQQFALKTLLPADAVELLDSSVRFRQESSAIARLSHPGIVSVIELGEAHGVPFMVMELLKGPNLNLVLQKGPLAITLALELASTMAGALGTIHQSRMVHRDIKPENIILVDGSHFKLIDFGLVAESGQQLDSPSSVVGTLTYSSPEQCGIISQPIDARSDLYSLGATLFEIVTGQAPFTSENLSTVLQEKMNLQIPNPSLSRPECSFVFGEIICKLLSSRPEDRYQSAQALLEDLNNLKALEEKRFNGTSYRLGEAQDQRQLREIPLIGRHREMDVLKSASERLSGSQGGAILIKGAEGSGKTALVSDAAQTLNRNGVHVLSSKCTRLDSIALSTVLDILNLHFHQISLLPEEQRLAEIQKLKDSPETIKRVICQISPDFGNYAGLPKPRISRENENQEVLFQNLIQLITQIAKERSGLVMIIEDIQWIDEATVMLLKKLSREIESIPLVLIVTTRTEDPSSNLAFELQEELGKVLIESLELAPLSEKDATEMVHRLLNVQNVDPKLIEKIKTVTHFNPLAMKDYLTALLHSSILSAHQGSVKLDFSRLAEIDISKDSFRRISQRLSSFDSQEKKILSYAALYGFRFPSDLLCKIMNLAPGTVNSALHSAVSNGFVETLDGRNYLFTHEQMREAVLASLDETVQNQIHREIADCLEQVDAKGPEIIYTLAHQYLSSISKDSPQRAIQALNKAGRYATKSYSYRQAYQFLLASYELSQSFTTEDQLALRCKELYAISCFNTGRSVEAEKALDQILNSKITAYAKAHALFWKCKVATAQGELEKAWDLYLQAMKALGKPYQTQKVGAVFSLLKHALQTWIQTKFKIGYGRYSADKEDQKDQTQKYELLCRMTELAVNNTYLRAKNFDALHLALRLSTYAFYLGPSPAYAKALALTAVIYSAGMLEKATAANFKIAYAVAENLDDIAMKTYLEYNRLLTLLFMGKFKEYDLQYPKHLPMIEKYLSSIYVGLALNANAGILSQRGRALELVEFGFRKLSQVDETHEYTMMINFREAYAARLELLGRLEDAARLRAEVAKFVEKLGPQNIWNRMQTAQLRLASALEKMEIFSEEVENHIRDTHQNNLKSFYLVPGFITSAQIRLIQYEVSTDPQEKKKYFELFKFANKKLKARAQTSISKCHLRIMQAAQARIEGDFEKAEKLLKLGDKLSVESDSANGRYWSFLERARLEKARGQLERSEMEARAAYEYSLQRKWKLRLDQLKAEFPFLKSEDHAGDETTTQAMKDDPSQRGSTAAIRGMAALLDISVAASKSIDPLSQGRSTLDELVRLMGAERACIFLKDKADSSLKFFLGRDGFGQDIQEMTGFSTTVIKKVFDEKKPAIITGTDQGEAIGSKSIVAHNLKSIMVVPLILMEDLKGVIYLDSSIAKGLFTEADLNLFAAISTQIAASIHISELATVESEKQVLQKDLELSASVQKMFLPSKTHVRYGKVSLTGFYRPASVCSGDWWWYKIQQDQKISIAVGDVTGHGAGAAMITASIASSFNLSEKIESKNVGQIMEVAHEQLFEIAKSEYAMSMFGCEINVENGQIRYWSAGAPFIFVLNKSRKTAQLGSPGTLLGLNGFSLGEGSYHAQAGDRLFIFSDGIVEMQTTEGRQVGEGRLRRILEKMEDLDGEKTKDALISELDRLRGPLPQDDDFTFVLVDIS